ncbi:MAG: GNAT family N-acetyltransferase [Acidimicrobiales bacterium]
MGPAPEEGTRPATDEDVARLAELAGAAVDELRQGRGGQVWARQAARRPPFEADLRAQVDDPGHRVLVGTVDDVVMGYAVARTDLLPDGGRLGVVTDLYTEPGARELGIGEAMMAALVEWCREQGCFGVDSLALPGDRHTKNFFESFGLVARAIVVHRSLT